MMKKLLFPPLHSTMVHIASVVALCTQAACTTPQAPVAKAVYDLGLPLAATARNPVLTIGAPTLAAPPAAPPAVILADIATGAALDSTAMLYRLDYADIQQLRPYTLARWSMPPAQLLRQRLREHLGQRRAVLNAADGSASTAPILLRIELEEFSQLFESPSISTGLLRLRATALQPSSQGERLLGQRSFTVQRPSPSADATGGVRALTAASDAAIEEIDLWLQQLR